MAGRTLLALLALRVLAGALLASAEGYTHHPVYGKLRLPGTAASGLLNALPCHVMMQAYVSLYAVFADKSIKGSKLKLVLSVNGGSQLQAFPTIDGSFTFPSVPAGTHMLDVISVDLLFPQVPISIHVACYMQHDSITKNSDHAGAARC